MRLLMASDRRGETWKVRSARRESEMIDYFAHVCALRVCISAMKKSSPSDPADPKAPHTALLDAGDQPGSAILGALVDHLLQYSQAATSSEIGILSQAAALFKKAVAILNQTTATRSDLEAGLTTPTGPGVVAAYNTALAALPGIATKVKNLQADLQTFQSNFSGSWMAAVGQQQGQPVPQWAWRDVFLGRRTTAFVANAQALAATPRERAFALGTFAGAAGNLIGSGYLNAVVGGPRRSHELRHRLAAYSVGAWLRDNESQYAETLAAIRAALTFNQSGTPTLPADIKSLIQKALHQTYPAGTAALPDLDMGYGNLMKHLSLLDEFTLPAVPPPMNNGLTLKALGFSLTLGADNIHPAGSAIGTNYPGIGAHESAGAVCLTLLAWLFWPPGAIIALDNALGNGPNAEAVAVDQSQLQTLSQSPAAVSAINSLYGMELSFWQGCAASRTALVLRGLLYPDPSDLSNPTFAQFLSLPPANSNYPLLSMPSSDDGTASPTSALEKPATSPSPFAATALPLAFLTGNTPYSVSARSSSLWIDMIEYPGSDRPGSANPNLDADRGFSAQCWSLAPGTTITSQPVQTVALSFTGI